MQQIWVAGRGMLDLEVVSVDRAVREYDNTLKFDFNEDTGQWCIFKYMGGRNPTWPEWLPVLAFQGVPTPDVAIKTLWTSDAQRNGEEILRDLMTQEPDPEIARRAEDATEAAASVLESFVHREGLTNYHRSLPKKDPKQQNKGW